MIDVPQESKLERVKTAVELYNELLGYSGRVLRIQKFSLERSSDHFSYGFYEREHSYYAQSEINRVYIQDSFGRLLGARLNESSRWLEQNEKPGVFAGTLTVMLDGQEKIVLDELDSSQVLLLQEDTRQWIPIFRGRNWKEIQR